jgi:CBS-domain-containing membrane protein
VNTNLFKTRLPHVPWVEKVKSGFAAAAGMFILALLARVLDNYHFPMMLLASMGASSVLLYAVPHSPMAQPWPLIGGHLVSALMGWLTISVVADPTLSASCAVGMAVLVMYLLNCLHPPGAATALICVLNAGVFREHGGWWFFWIVTGNAFISLLAAWAVNKPIPGRHYPAKSSVGRPQMLGNAAHINVQDVERALSEMDSAIDVTAEDLLDIYASAVSHAEHRRRN